MYHHPQMLPNGQVIPGYYQQVILVQNADPIKINGFQPVQQPQAQQPMPQSVEIKEEKEVE